MLYQLTIDEAPRERTLGLHTVCEAPAWRIGAAGADRFPVLPAVLREFAQEWLQSVRATRCTVEQYRPLKLHRDGLRSPAIGQFVAEVEARR
jgi:hypothetical protein